MRVRQVAAGVLDFDPESLEPDFDDFDESVDVDFVDSEELDELSLEAPDAELLSLEEAELSLDEELDVSDVLLVDRLSFL